MQLISSWCTEWCESFSFIAKHSLLGMRFGNPGGASDLVRSTLLCPGVQAKQGVRDKFVRQVYFLLILVIEMFEFDGGTGSF